MTVKKNYLVEKRNVLNELRSNNMTLQELRFFSNYLAKINARDINTRVVRFKMSDFQAVMEFGRLNMSQLKATTDGLLMKIVHVPIKETGGYKAFQLFKECAVDKDENDEWHMEIDAHDKALPLLFEFKERYFTYELWNALRLRSSNQLRMYELLKQYENAGERILSVADLKSLLGVDENEYPRFNDFKTRVLDACQDALAEYTDICFTYEPCGRRGAGGKILQIKFIISKNANYADPLELKKFIDMKNMQNEADYIIYDNDALTKNEVNSEYVGRINLLTTALNDEFSFEEAEYLNAIITDYYLDDKAAYKYLSAKYKYLNSKKQKIKNRYSYLRKVIEKEIEERLEKEKKATKEKYSEEEQKEELPRLEKILERMKRNNDASDASAAKNASGLI